MVFALGAWAWWHVPSASVWLAFLVGQGMTLALVAARYWQRASEAAWFTANVPEEALVTVVAPVTVAAPVPEAAPLLGDSAAPGVLE